METVHVILVVSGPSFYPRIVASREVQLGSLAAIGFLLQIRDLLGDIDRFESSVRFKFSRSVRFKFFLEPFLVLQNELRSLEKQSWTFLGGKPLFQVRTFGKHGFCSLPNVRVLPQNCSLTGGSTGLFSGNRLSFTN